ncbi:metabolite traffic protein EboE [Desulfovibrio aerotolerans]|uniref:Metabolite traffic protein EboE n=1 Tax=Solidesulfovibrio aerotolerans TaxID=295255 RepID=A0A7C9IJW4_9BACT|nr:metabolite traffic protein EboE [Solidesulfovibrio aerotolerans]MYL82004.1 metabolite traffic protein EboE [Solidesulfovibrio aerotolerans]
MEPTTYCTNIHPGESWEEIRAGVLAHAPAVAAAVCPTRPFPVGLRLSGRASLELDAAAAQSFAAEAATHGLTFRTLNGFPYGRFHHTPVKERVYQPDWRDPERAAYTLRLARLLAGWLPEGGSGSISTVPIGFRRGFPETDLPKAYAALRGVLGEMAELFAKTGRRIRLAVEAEPGCLIETTAQMVAFFAELNAPPAHMAHLCVCYDCCHQALQYEDPAASLAALAAAGIEVGHVQVSSALHLEGGDLTPLARFVEPVYLHQAVARLTDGSLRRFDDLPQALAARLDGVASWRVHFHLPVFVAHTPQCGTTQPFLQTFLPLLAPDIPLEVETYTWSVLPPELKMADVTQSIIREIAWVEAARRP